MVKLQEVTFQRSQKLLVSRPRTKASTAVAYPTIEIE